MSEKAIDPMIAWQDRPIITERELGRPYTREEILMLQLRQSEARYMALIEEVASGRAFLPSPPIIIVSDEAIGKHNLRKLRCKQCDAFVATMSLTVRPFSALCDLCAGKP